MDSRGAAPAGRSRLRTFDAALACPFCPAVISTAASSGVAGGDCDVILQLVEAAGSNDVSRVNAFHLGDAAVGYAGLYAAHMSDIVLNYVHERCRAILLNGRCRNQGHALQSVHQQTRIHKLIGKERVVLIGKDSPRFHGSGGRVDLVIER